jgi:hypothetical protein
MDQMGTTDRDYITALISYVLGQGCKHTSIHLFTERTTTIFAHDAL